MSWINKYVEGTFGLFAGNTIENFQPLDFFNFFPLWYDLWIDRIATMLDKLDADKKHYSDLKDLLPTSSNMVAIIQKTIPSYKAFIKKDPQKTKRVLDFFARMIEEGCPGDPFKVKSNPCHTKTEVVEIVRTTPWQPVGESTGKQVGRLIATTGSLVHGLYNDLVTDFAWDAYGPYKIEYNGEKYILLIRNFPDLRPIEIWSDKYLPELKELQIYGLYQGIEWEISGVGCHTLVKSGNPVTSLKHFAVMEGNNPVLENIIPALNNSHADLAQKLYGHIRTFDFEQLKSMVQLQEAYQLKKMFEAAGMDWKPTAEMAERIKDKSLLKGTLPHGVMASNLEEYKELYNIRYFAKEVLNEQI